MKPAWLDHATYERLPSSLAVRVVRAVPAAAAGFRTTELHLATTVKDPEIMSAAQAGALYLRRWQVELFIGDLKTTLGMAVLRTKSPALIHRELLVHLIAYNLLRALIASSGTPAGASFKGTLDRIHRWLPALSETASPKTRKRLVEDLHELISEDLVPERPHRREPRAVKRRPQTVPTDEQATGGNG